MSYKGGKKSKICGPEEGYNLFASSYDAGNVFLDTFEEGVLESFLPVLKGKQVLDIGCGTGRAIGHIYNEGAEITGVDVSEEMLKIAGKKYRLCKFVRGDIEDLPFEDESFDVVIAAFVIVHLGDLRRAFEEVYRVLKPGGVFVLTNINQRKAPKLKVGKKEIVIQSFYHLPIHVMKALNEAFFKAEKVEFVYEGKTWVNQLIKAVK